jgi:hypothetical protein
VTAGARAALQFTRAQLRGVETSSLTESQLVHGLREHARSGQRLGQVLISLGYITDSQLTVALDRQRQPVTDTVRTTDAADCGLWMAEARRARRMRAGPLESPSWARTRALLILESHDSSQDCPPS